MTPFSLIPRRHLVITVLFALLFVGTAAAETEFELRREGRDKVYARATKLAEGVYIFKKVPTGKYYAVVKYENKEYSTARSRNPLPIIVRNLSTAEEEARKEVSKPEGGHPYLRYEWLNSPLIVQFSVQGLNIGVRILTR